MLIPNKFSGYSRDGVRLYYKKQDAPAPDPAMGEAAKQQIALNREMYDDYRNNDRPWMQSIADRALAVSEGNAKKSAELTDYQLGAMKKNDDRYRNVAVPFEDQLLSDVNRYDSQGYKTGQINAAKADVQESFDNAQAETARGLMRRGVNPGSGMALATRGMGDIGKATALATAANKTRLAADQIGLSNKMSIYGGMKGLSGLGATNASLAAGAIGAGNASGSGMTNAAGSYLGANNAALAGYNSGTSAGIGGLGQYTSLGIQSTQANNAADPMGTVLGAVAGAGAAYATGGLSTMGKNASWAK